MAIPFAGTAPPKPAKRMEVRRITSSESELYVCLSASVWGQGVHWCGKRTEECLAERKLECPGCCRGLPWKWKGYLHVVDASQAECFLELTATAIAALNAQMPDRNNLRGAMFRLKRTKGGAKGRYVVEVLDRVIPESELHAGKDPLETLRFLWSVKRSYMSYDHQ
jgi:hypothetical protein